MATIQIGVDVIDRFSASLRLIRADLPDVSAGINPQDATHAHGFPLNAVAPKGGSSTFAAGTGAAGKAASLGTAVDGWVTAFDTELSTLVQNLRYLRNKAEETEYLNMGAAETAGRLHNTGSSTTTA